MVRSFEHLVCTENLVALAWRRADPRRRVWVEHEGRHVGACLVPARLFSSLRSPELLVLLDVPRAARVSHLVALYAVQRADSTADCGVDAGSQKGVPPATVDELAAAVESLRKRRGGAETANALSQLRRGDFAAVGRGPALCLNPLTLHMQVTLM